MVARMRAAGAIIVGKTNTPEFGLGTLTFNDLFGPTRNPYDVTRHAGGISGGAAAAVAAGLLPIADGSDSGGSLRYPASFCNVVGFRPSAGRVPSSRAGDAWSPHGILGPMARTCADAGLLLAGDGRARIPTRRSRSSTTRRRSRRVEPTGLRGLRVAWSDTVGGLPIDPGGDARRCAARARCSRPRAASSRTPSRTSRAPTECWEVIELLGFLMYSGADVDAHPELLRDDLVRNVRRGARAHGRARSWPRSASAASCSAATAELLERYDVLAFPGAPVIAPPIEVPWVAEIAGGRLDRYFLWQRAACRLTVTAHPVLALPAAFARRAAGRPAARRPQPRRARPAAHRRGDRGGHGPGRAPPRSSDARMRPWTTTRRRSSGP